MLSMDKNKKFCHELAKVESEEDLVKIIKKYGYWDKKYWRNYGDIENNMSIISNQQAKPIPALAELLVNCGDTVLTKEILLAGIDPEGKNAPKNMKEAVEKMFNIKDGDLSNLSTHDRAILAEKIKLIATGSKSNPNYIVVDDGEGQAPENFDKTFLSLNKSNKLKIPFVQGKYNMGSGGVLSFCEFKLIISKKDPKLRTTESDKWGFTIIRKEAPSNGNKSSIYTYLAPNNNVLTFSANKLNILPKVKRVPHSIMSSGTFIKLYNYKLVEKSQVTFGFYNSLSLFLCSPPLPIKIIDSRKYKSDSPFAYINGLTIRLKEDKKNNVENNFPSSASINVSNVTIPITIYALKEGKHEKYKNDESILYTVNGQTQGVSNTAFMTRKSVGMSYMSNSILLTVDFTNCGGEAMENMFMGSRDRLKETEFSKQVRNEIAIIINKHAGLRELQNKRSKLATEKSIKNSSINTMKKLMKMKTMSKLFKSGTQISNPFNLNNVKEKTHFIGKTYPSFFKILKDFKKCPINKRFRIQFQTDVDNDYLDSNRGVFKLYYNKYEQEHSINLYNGIATLNVELPDNVNINDKISYTTLLKDNKTGEFFINRFNVFVENPEKKSPGGTGTRKTPSGNEHGGKNKNASKLNPPTINIVRKIDWDTHGFTEKSILKVRGSEEDGFNFFINIDNKYILSGLKGKDKIRAMIDIEKYKEILTIFGIGYLFDYVEKEDEDADEDIFKTISKNAEIQAPFLSSIIESLNQPEILEHKSKPKIEEQTKLSKLKEPKIEEQTKLNSNSYDDMVKQKFFEKKTF